MARLLFYDADHRYELDGEVLPSVSEIIRFIKRETYDDVRQRMLDIASDRGTRAHKATQAIDLYGEVECDDDVVCYVTAYVQFLKDYAPRWQLIEKPLYNAELGFAGTIDRAGFIGDKRYIIDFKAQEQIKKPLVSAQLNGYGKLYTAFDELACLQLMKNGAYRFHSIPRDDSTFMACLTLHNAMKTKKRRKAV